LSQARDYFWSLVGKGLYYIFWGLFWLIGFGDARRGMMIIAVIVGLAILAMILFVIRAACSRRPSKAEEDALREFADDDRGIKRSVDDPDARD
jgi:hypothetical protein